MFVDDMQVMRSSGFEGMLLKATWPGDDPVPHDILGEIIKYSIPAFKFTGVVRRLSIINSSSTRVSAI